MYFFNDEIVHCISSILVFINIDSVEMYIAFPQSHLF